MPRRVAVGMLRLQVVAGLITLCRLHLLVELTVCFSLECRHEYHWHIWCALCSITNSLAILQLTCNSALMLLFGRQEGHLAFKKLNVGCWHSYLSRARCGFAYGPADATATQSLLLQ